MTVDCYIRAPDEAAFRTDITGLNAETLAEDGSLRTVNWWSGERSDLDAGFPIVTAPAVLDAEGNIVTPAVLDPNWYANLRCSDAAYDRLGVVTGGTYVLAGGTEIFGAVRLEGGATLHGAPPATPQRVWF